MVSRIPEIWSSFERMLVDVSFLFLLLLTAICIALFIALEITHFKHSPRFGIRHLLAGTIVISLILAAIYDMTH
jgi:hypothetical protein